MVKLSKKIYLKKKNDNYKSTLEMITKYFTYDNIVIDSNCTKYKDITFYDSYSFYYDCFKSGFKKLAGNNYSYTFYNDVELTLISYCEGDIYLQKFNNNNDYQKEKEYSKNFHIKND